MKRVSVFLVAMMLLLALSVTAATAQSVPISDDLTPTINAGEPIIKKWVEDYLITYEPEQPICQTFMYDRGGFQGILYLSGYIRFSDGSAYAWYEGWVYGGSGSVFSVPTC